MVYSIISISFYPILFLLIWKKRFTIWLPLLVLVLIVHIIKYITQKERPDHSDKLSFPSGHSATVWFLVSMYEWNPLVFTWAILVSISRVALQRHYPVDVAVGGMLGYIFSILPQLQWHP